MADYNVFKMNTDGSLSIKPNSYIDLSGNILYNCNQITAPVDLTLNPVGSISCNGKTIDLTGGEIHNTPLVHSQNNSNIIIEGKGTGSVILKSGNANRITLNDSGITVMTDQISLARVMEKTTAGSVSSNTLTLDYTAINGLVTATPSSANNIGLVITNVPTTAGSYNLTFLIDVSTNKQYINSFNINGSAFSTPIASGGFANLTVDASATSCLQYVSIIMASGSVNKVITNLVSLY